MSGAMKTKTVIIATNTRKREKNGVDVRGEKEAAGKYIEYTEEDSPISLMSVILMGFCLRGWEEAIEGSAHEKENRHVTS